MTKTNKKRLALVCKTYRNDHENFCRFIDSYKKHNKDNLPLYISIPEDDLGIFKNFESSRVKIVTDESYAEQYFADDMYWGLSLGYINQEICKLAFWENDFADNYLFVDSDAYFIRDFGYKDFMANDTTPYSVLVMDKDLNTQNFYRDFGIWRLDHIKRIFKEVGYEDERFRTCHGMTVMNAAVLQDFKKNFLEKRKIGYKNLIEMSPYEYSWYNAWLQKSDIIEVVAVEPFFKTFHMRKEYEFSRAALIKEEDLAIYYVGIIMNSNWEPIPPPRRYKNPGKLCRKIYNHIGKLT